MERTIVNPIFKDTVTFVKTAAETNGQVTEMLLTLMPGGSNPLHCHTAYDEKFVAIKGALGLQLADKNCLLQPGQECTVPAGTLHRFYNPTSAEISFRIEFNPGHEGAERMLRIMYGLARDGKTNGQGIPKSLATIALVSEMGDSALPGFFTWIAPILKRMAASARKRGLEKQLLDAYCR
ncbi:MAG: cupin domain-containing protein [Ferruginibacter sp.]|nr:cupin domain-containing protein [Cytophagales bacterium]